MGGFVKASSSGGVTNHGALTGLADDDHTQYFKGFNIEEDDVPVITGQRTVSLNFDGEDFDVADDGGGQATVTLAVTPIAGIDAQEDGVSVVAAATAFNFDPDDFTLTDEGSNVVGVALDATLYAGTYLAIDGSNRMQSTAEIRSLHGVLDYETGSDVDDVTDEFAGSELDTALWYEVGPANSDFSQGIDTGTFSFNTDVTNSTTIGGVGSLHSRWTIQGDFEVVTRIQLNRAAGSANQGCSGTLYAANSADWAVASVSPTDPNYARIAAGWLGSPAVSRWGGRMTGTEASQAGRSNDDVWVRIVRVGTAVTTYYNDAGGVGGDTPPVSWTQLQTKANAGLDDEIVFGIQYAGNATGGTSGSGSYARFTRVELVSADTINASTTTNRGWRLDISADIDDDGCAFSVRRDTSSTAVLMSELVKETAGAAFRVYDDAGTAYVELAMEAADESNLEPSAGGLHLQRAGTGNVELFEGVTASAANKKLVLYGHDDVTQHNVEIFHDGDWLWIASLEGTGEGIILRSEPGVWRFQTGSTVHAAVTTNATDVTLGLASSPAAQHALLTLGAKTSATTAAPYIAWERQGNDGTYLNLAADDNYRLSIWENADPGDLSGTPAGFLGLITSKDSAEYSSGLIANVDAGLRTDSPTSLAFNVGGTYRRLAFGACDDYAGMYVSDGAGSQALTTAGTYELVTQWTTAYGESRRATADPTTDDDITSGTSGRFLLLCQVSFTGTANAEVKFKLTTTGGTVDIPGATCTQGLDATNAPHSAVLFGVETLSPSTPVELYWTSDDDSDDLALIDAQLIAIKLSDA